MSDGAVCGNASGVCLWCHPCWVVSAGVSVAILWRKDAIRASVVGGVGIRFTRLCLLVAVSGSRGKARSSCAWNITSFTACVCSCACVLFGPSDFSKRLALFISSMAIGSAPASVCGSPPSISSSAP